MKKLLLVLTMLFIITGCKEKEINNKLEVNCNDDIINVVDIRKGDTISCKLMGEEYVLTIKSSTESKVVFESNKIGITDTSSLLEKKKIFTLEKDKELKLYTQTTDYQQKLIINWK